MNALKDSILPDIRPIQPLLFLLSVKIGVIALNPQMVEPQTFNGEVHNTDYVCFNIQKNGPKKLILPVK